MAISNIELRREVKILRTQFSTLEKKCKEREDKLAEILMTLEPFIEMLTKAQQVQLLEKLDR